MSREITYVKGSITELQGTGTKIVIHIVNNVGVIGGGVSGPICKKWPEAKEIYKALFDAAKREPEEHLGTNLVAVNTDDYDPVWIINMVAQNGTISLNNPHPIRLDALSKCLEEVAYLAHTLKATVHGPRIGCGLAGGKWEDVEPLLQKILVDNGVDVIIYDLE